MSALRTYQGGVAIVTGAASGIGKAVSEELAARGCEVVMADLDADVAEKIAGEIRSRGGKASAHRLDVTDAAAVKKLVDETHARAGRLDYIFNNAGIAVAGEAENYTLAGWRKIVEVNLMGVVHGVIAAYPLMQRQGFGHLVNTASSAGLIALPGGIGYCATKHAVVGLSKTLRAEGHLHGVRVSAVCPGVIRTAILTGGKHGMLLFKAGAENGRKFSGEMFEKLRPIAPEVFARTLLDRVAKNHAVIVIPNSWRFMIWFTERLFPSLGRLIARKMFADGSRRLQELERA